MADSLGFEVADSAGQSTLLLWDVNNSTRIIQSLTACNVNAFHTQNKRSQTMTATYRHLLSTTVEAVTDIQSKEII